MNEIAVYPHKTCIFALEKSCLTSKANLCIMQKLEPLLNHYLYSCLVGSDICIRYSVNRSF